MLLVLVLLSFLMYLIYSMIPFDRARALAEEQRAAYKNDPAGFEAAYQNYRHQLGLDRSVVFRYLRWIGLVPIDGVYDGLLQGSLGWSFRYSRPAAEVLAQPLRNTVFLNLFSTALSLGITIPLGIFCAVHRGSRRDTAVQIGTVVGYSVPGFIAAILFICLFAVILPVFPVSGMKTPGSSYTGLRKFFDELYYMALPILVMTFSSLGGMTRYVRAAMTEALTMDCVRTARAKGLRERAVIWSHAWRNALIPVITLVIGWFLRLFSGSLMIENIFALNGMGKLYITCLNANDYEVVLLLQMFYVTLALLGNLLIDIAYGLADPRVRADRTERG